MMGRIKLPLAGAVVGIALVVTIAVASASLRITVERAGAITGASLGALTFRSPLATVACNLSLTGSIERASGFEGYAGSASRASVSSCTGATVITRTETPWDIIYERPLGTLPRLTEMATSFENVDLLLDVNFFGIHTRCEVIGHFEALTPLTAEGESFRTGLSTIQATGQGWRVYTELDATGFCPSGEEVSVSGRFQDTTWQMFMIAEQMPVISPARPIIYRGTETRTFTFRNETTGPLTVERVRLDVNSRFTLPGGATNQCLTQPGETSKTIAMGGTCTVDVTFTNLLNGRIAWHDTLRLLTSTGLELGRAFLRYRP